MIDLVKFPDAGNCIHQNTYEVHSYCSLMKQKDIFCIHHLEEKKCPFYEEPKLEGPSNE